jgi:hypothetical protein
VDIHSNLEQKHKIHSLKFATQKLEIQTIKSIEKTLTKDKSLKNELMEKL